MATTMMPIQQSERCVANTYIVFDNPMLTQQTTQDNISDTTSLASSIMAYRRENGRTYHAFKDGSKEFPIPANGTRDRQTTNTILEYVLPNDDVSLACPSQRTFFPQG